MYLAPDQALSLQSVQNAGQSRALVPERAVDLGNAHLSSRRKVGQDVRLGLVEVLAQPGLLQVNGDLMGGALNRGDELEGHSREMVATFGLKVNLVFSTIS
jgi:hypothetical protein